MTKTVITISREFGSGGRTVGKALADRLGIPCYDSEIIEKVAEKSGFDVEYVESKSENAKNAPLSGIFRSNSYYRSSNEDIIWAIQTKIINELADRGPCVIVGRCADYILRDRENLLRVFIRADMDFRAERIVKVYGESDESPEKRIRDKEKRRAAYYQLYTEKKWGDARNYDVCLNSGLLGIDRCVDILCEICE